MIIDFSDLKQIMVEQIDHKLDHGFMYSTEDKIMKSFFNELEKDVNQRKFKHIEVNFIPTAENISKYIFLLLKKPLIERDIKLKFVKTWETPTCSAIFSEEV